MEAETEELKVEKIFARIMREKKLSKQDFAAYIGYDSSKMSQKFGTHWDMHWRVFIKLLPDLVRLKIIDPKILDATSDKKRELESCESEPKGLKSLENTPGNVGPDPDIMLSLGITSFILQ